MSEGTMSAQSGDTSSTAPVELRVRARFGQLPVLRAMAETIAVLADFDLDAVSDITMAVDEVCSELITDAAVDADVVCRFEVVDDCLNVRIHADTASGRVPNEQSFGWHVLRTLTDSLAATHVPPGSGSSPCRTTIAFSRSRGGDR